MKGKEWLFQILLLDKTVYDYWSQSSHAVCVHFNNLTIGSCSVDLQSMQPCLFAHRQKTCVVWRCVGIQWMIWFAFLTSQVYQTHAIETRYTIASFHLFFLYTGQSSVSFLSCFNQDNRLPPSFLSSLSLYSCLCYFAVLDRCISLSVPSISTNWSIDSPFMDICNWVSESKASKQNQASKTYKQTTVFPPHLLVQSSPVQSSPVQSFHLTYLLVSWPFITRVWYV